jgi:hypothetical protein
MKAAIKDNRAYAILKEGHPAAIVAWEFVDPHLFTGFWATEEFFTIGSISDLRFQRDLIRTIQTEQSGPAVVSNSFGTHEQLAKWYLCLGFMEHSSDKGFRTFVLPVR